VVRQFIPGENIALPDGRRKWKMGMGKREKGIGGLYQKESKVMGDRTDGMKQEE